MLERISRGRFNTDTGGDSAQYDGFDAAAAKVQVEVGAVERAPLAFCHHDVARLGTKFGRDFIPPGRRRPHGPLKVDWTLDALACRAEGHSYENDWSIDFAERLREADRVAQNYAGRMRRYLSSDDAILEVRGQSFSDRLIKNFQTWSFLPLQVQDTAIRPVQSSASMGGEQWRNRSHE